MENDLNQEPSSAPPPPERPEEEEDISATQPTPVSQNESQALDETQAVPAQRQNLEETQPTPLTPSSPTPNGAPGTVGVYPAEDPAGGAQEPPGGKPALRRRPWQLLLYAALALLLLLSIGFASGYGGYLSAIGLRLDLEATQVNDEAQRQFDLGMQDMQAGRYDLARQRFEFVINLNPNFPGITEALAQVLLEINTTATPTTAPTPTLSPTPDLRSQEDLYLQARETMAGADWTTAIDTLLTLRKRFPEYMIVEVDGLLYVALRNRGVEKISLLYELEGGTYDLTLAEGFGPLDVEARNWRDWAVLYIRGASFWDVDWQQAVYYFSQLAQIAPNLMDGSRLTSIERYALSLIGYGDWLARQEMWCDAQEQYELSFNLRGSPEVEPTASYVAEQCANPEPSGGEGGGVVTLTPTLSPTPGGEVTPTSPPPQDTPTATQPPPEQIPTPTAAEDNPGDGNG